jgi:hypothetical protein
VGSNAHLAGAQVTVLGQGSLEPPAGTKDTFGGWTMTPNVGTAYAPGQTFTMLAQNVNLYALWKSGGGTESFAIISATRSFFEDLK